MFDQESYANGGSAGHSSITVHQSTSPKRLSILYESDGTFKSMDSRKVRQVSPFHWQILYLIWKQIIDTIRQVQDVGHFVLLQRFKVVGHVLWTLKKKSLGFLIKFEVSNMICNTGCFFLMIRFWLLPVGVILKISSCIFLQIVKEEE